MVMADMVYWLPI